MSLIAENTLAYAYQMGEEEKTKLAIIKVDLGRFLKSAAHCIFSGCTSLVRQPLRP